MAFHFTIKNASIQDTLRYILNFVNRYSTDPFVLHFTNEFNPTGNKQDFIKRVFDYICKHGEYQLDKDGEEEVWTPAKIISTRNANGKFQYDCKKITILLGSVLKCAGIEPVLKHVLYKNDGGESDGPDGFKTYTHIYIVVPMPDMQHYLTVDPTNNKMWNTEVDHSKGTLYFLNGTTQPEKMNLHLVGNNNQQKKGSASLADFFGESAGQIHNDMNAIVGCPDQTVSGKNQYFSYTTAEAIAHAAKVPALAISRNAFLGLLYLGKLLANTPLKLRLADHIAYAWNANPNAVRKLWWKLGGTADASALRTALVKVVGGTIRGPVMDAPASSDRPWIIKDYNYGHTGMNGSIGQGPATLAAITAATPIIAEVLKFLKDNKIIKDGQIDPTVPTSTPPAIPTNGEPAPDAVPDGTACTINNGPGVYKNGVCVPVSSGSILDLSSPVNTIVKSVFLMGLSGMMNGPHYFILNGFCVGAIIYSFIRISK